MLNLVNEKDQVVSVDPVLLYTVSYWMDYVSIQLLNKYILDSILEYSEVNYFIRFFTILFIYLDLKIYVSCVPFKTYVYKNVVMTS